VALFDDDFSFVEDKLVAMFDDGCFLTSRWVFC
jgi:hypothetical protein